MFQALQIAEGIESTRNHPLAEFQDDSDAKGLINEKLDYLIDGSRRQGRKDWFHARIKEASNDQTLLLWLEVAHTDTRHFKRIDNNEQGDTYPK